VKKISLSFCNNNVIDKEDIEIYEYGLEILLLTIFEVVSIIVISIFLNKLFVTLLFLLSFCVLRLFAGGYHAKTSGRCYLEFLAVYTIYLITQYLSLPLTVVPIAFSAISELVILLYAPVDHENKRLSRETAKRCRLISILVVSVETLAVVILFLIKSHFTYCISLGQLAAAISLLVVKIKERKEVLQ
jgi:accessory gene regulator B